MSHGKAWMYYKRVCYPPCPQCWGAYQAQLAKNARRCRDVRVDESRGRPSRYAMVDASAAHSRVAELIDTYGFTQRKLVSQIGVSDKTIRDLYRARRPFVLGSTHRAIAMIYKKAKAEEKKFDPKAKGDLVAIDVAQRAIRGLNAQGWTTTWIAQQLGLNIRAMSSIGTGYAHKGQRRKKQYVHKDTEAGLLRLVRSIGSTQGPSKQVASLAKNRGWKPTMYHDDLV